MKTKLTFVMLAVMMLFAAAPVYASINGPIPTYTEAIIGTVYHDGVPYHGATVNATCFDGNKSSFKTTDAGGFYDLGINCSTPGTITVDAYVDDSLFGTASGMMHSTWFNIDMDSVDITMIPVFGFVAIPFLLSMAGFVFMRRRK